MTKNPFLNALSAAGYIVFVASLMYYAGQHTQGPDGLIVPITMLSLFVLSAAVMGFLFFYQPVQMYLDGEKKGAVDLFLKTVAVFACITLVFLAIAFSTATRI